MNYIDLKSYTSYSLTLKRPGVFLKIYHVFICLLKSKNLKNESAHDIAKG
jgi:hypothetical protein